MTERRHRPEYVLDQLRYYDARPVPLLVGSNLLKLYDYVMNNLMGYSRLIRFCKLNDSCHNLSVPSGKRYNEQWHIAVFFRQTTSGRAFGMARPLFRLPQFPRRRGNLQNDKQHHRRQEREKYLLEKMNHQGQE